MCNAIIPNRTAAAQGVDSRLRSCYTANGLTKGEKAVKYELMTPTEQLVDQFYKFWFGEPEEPEWMVSLFAKEAPTDIRLLIPEAEFEKWGAKDREIAKKLTKSGWKDALKAINAAYSTRVNTESIAEGLTWEKLEKHNVDWFVQHCKALIRRNPYSFATKVYSFLDPETYPIYDAIAATLLSRWLEGTDAPKKNRWGNYSEYKTAYDRFKAAYGLEKCSYKKIDVFLWTYGVALQRRWRADGVLTYESVPYQPPQ